MELFNVNKRKSKKDFIMVLNTEKGFENMDMEQQTGSK